MIWSWLLPFCIAAPLAAALLGLIPPVRKTLPWLMALAPLPALAVALFAPPGTLTPLPDVLLGAALRLDEVGRVFLGVTALLWSLSGAFAQAYMGPERRGRFAGFWLATLAGNIGVFIAADAISFYLAFALVSLAAFGLVIHARTPEARRAARIYIVLTLVGETALLMGLLIAATEAGSIMLEPMRAALAGSPLGGLAVGLFVIAFGIKAGLMPLHVWLPLAHPEAPTPASAVLSGAIVKAGIIGFARLLPLDAGEPGWSAALVAAGLATAYLGVLFGLSQTRVKTLLAYSTLSQMGLVVVVLAAAMAAAGERGAVMAASFYAAHHALAKGALFLSVGALPAARGPARTLVLALAALAALAVAGLPITGGALAKLAIKDWLAPDAAGTLVSLSAVGTTLLMLRFLWLLRREASADETRAIRSFTVVVSFALTALAALLVPWLVFAPLTGHAAAYALAPANLWSAAWPVVAGAALGMVLLRIGRRPSIPEGDLIVPAQAALVAAAGLARRLPGWRPPPVPAHAGRAAGKAFQAFEGRLLRWPATAAALATTGLALALMLWLSS